MFPFMFLGLGIANWWDSFFSSDNNTNSNNNQMSYKYVNHVVTDSLLNVKFGIEENYQLKTNAYLDVKKVWTIGIGTVDVWDENGKYVLKTYQGLTLLVLKSKMNKLHLSDLDFSFHLMRNHIKKSKSYTVFSDLDKNLIPYDSNLADAIIDFYYNSGSAYAKPSYYNFIQELKQKATASNLKLAYAIAYVRYRLSYLESWSPVMYGSWIRRVQIFADRIANNDLSMENNKSWKFLTTSVKVKSYILATYFYSLKKPLK